MGAGNRGFFGFSEPSVIPPYPMPYGTAPLLTPPNLAAFTEVAPAAGSSCVQDGATILAIATSGNQNYPFIKSAPSTPYKIVAGFQYWGGSGDCGAEFYWRDSGTGRLVSIDFTPNIYGVQWLNWNSPTSWNVTVWASGWMNSFVSPLVWARVGDTGSTFTFDLSVDGITFEPVYSVSRTAWLANPNQIGFGVRNSGGGPNMMMRLFSWKEN